MLTQAAPGGDVAAPPVVIVTMVGPSYSLDELSSATAVPPAEVRPPAPPVASPAQPSGRSPDEILADLRRSMATVANARSRELCGAVLRGDAFAAPGARDATLQRIASVIGYLEPDEDPAVLVQVLDASIRHFQDVDAGTYTHESNMEWAADKIARAQAAKRRERAGNDGVAGGLARAVAPAAPSSDPDASDLPPVMTSAEAIAALNTRHFVVDSLGGKVRIGAWEPTSFGEHLVFQNQQDFALRYANRKVRIETVTADGATSVKRVPLAPYWLSSPDRRSHSTVGLYPPPAVLPRGSFNLWRGFAIEPRPGSWPLMRAHLREIVAAGDPALDEYIIRWIAFAFQNPGRQAEVALVVRGQRGTGKGIVGTTLRRIFGTHGLAISQPKHLVGAFNRHLMSTVFLFVDEGFWAGNRSHEGPLKSLITEDTLTIEPKGVDAFLAPNRLHVLMASNEDWVIPAGVDERRFVVADVSSARAQDFGYFAALHRELDNGGREAMLHDLLALDLSGWHPRMIVKTSALTAQKWRSLSGLDAWFGDILCEGLLPRLSSDGKIPPAVASSRALLESAIEYARRRGDRATITSNQLAEFFRSMGAHKAPGTAVKRWAFPTLARVREIWDASKAGPPPGGWDAGDWRTESGPFESAASAGASVGARMSDANAAAGVAVPEPIRAAMGGAR